MDNEKYITLYDEDGNELLYEVLFTFDSDEYEKSYILLIPAEVNDEDEDDVEVQAFSYTGDQDDDDLELEPIETQEEWDMVEEVLNTFLEDDQLNGFDD